MLSKLTDAAGRSDIGNIGSSHGLAPGSTPGGCNAHKLLELICIMFCAGADYSGIRINHRYRRYVQGYNPPTATVCKDARQAPYEHRPSAEAKDKSYKVFPSSPHKYPRSTAVLLRQPLHEPRIEPAERAQLERHDVLWREAHYLPRARGCAQGVVRRDGAC